MEEKKNENKNGNENKILSDSEKKNENGIEIQSDSEKKNENEIQSDSEKKNDEENKIPNDSEKQNENEIQNDSEKKNENEKVVQSDSEKKNETISENSEKNQPDQKNKGKLDGPEQSQQKQKRKRIKKLNGSGKGSNSESKSEEVENNQPYQNDKEKLDEFEKNQQNQKKRRKIGRAGKGNNVLKKNESRSEDTGKNQPDQKNKAKLNESETQNKQRKKQKHDGESKGVKSENNHEKHSQSERGQKNENRRDKPGGVIFMCNSRTKPDCFRYRVMGISMNKKDVVLTIKPGMKLFLYDFDLKLLYGIYRALSSGGTKLEPAAFGGGFPAQVRFEVHKDCFPLPESVFKKAIKENYSGNKFKTELTDQQVRKLSVLFRPANVPSNAHIHTPPREKTRDRERYEGTRYSRSHLRGERYARDPNTDHDSRRHHLQSLEMEHGYREVATMRREELPRKSFMTEQEYRTYGLRGNRQSMTPPRQAAPLDHYQRDDERDLQLRHPPLVYREVAPSHTEPSQYDPVLLSRRQSRAYNLVDQRQLQSPVHHAPRLLDGREYRTYGLDAYRESQPQATLINPVDLDPYSKDPYYVYREGDLSTDPYRPSVRTEEVPSGSHYYLQGRREGFLTNSDQLQRRETDQVERSYSAYASNSSSDYNHRHQYPGSRPEQTFMPVSSHYTFAGPSSRH